MEGCKWKKQCQISTSTPKIPRHTVYLLQGRRGELAKSIFQFHNKSLGKPLRDLTLPMKVDTPVEQTTGSKSMEALALPVTVDTPMVPVDPAKLVANCNKYPVAPALPVKAEASAGKTFHGYKAHSKSQFAVAWTGIIIVLVFLSITAVDLWFSFSKHLSVEINDAHVTFENSIQADTYQRVYGKGGIVTFVNINYNLKSTLRHNVGISSLNCDIFATDSLQMLPLQVFTLSGTELNAKVDNTDGNGIRRSEVNIVVDDIDFSYVRKCVSLNCGLESLRAVCKVKVQVNLYGFIPIKATLPFKQSLPMNLHPKKVEQQQQQDSTESSSVPNDSNPSTSKRTLQEISNSTSIKSKDLYNLQPLQVNLDTILYKLDLFLPKTPMDAGSYLSVKSVHVHIPSMSYQMGFLNASKDFKWEMNSTAFDMNIINGGSSTVFLSMNCVSADGESCSLTSPVGPLIESVYQGDMSFIALTEEKNFFASSLGTFHYMSYQSPKTKLDISSRSRYLSAASGNNCNSIDIDDIIHLSNCGGEIELYSFSVSQNDWNIHVNGNFSYQFSHDIVYLGFFASANNFGNAHAILDYRNSMLKFNTILNDGRSGITKNIVSSDVILDWSHLVVSDAYTGVSVSIISDVYPYWYSDNNIEMYQKYSISTKMSFLLKNMFEWNVMVPSAKVTLGPLGSRSVTGSIVYQGNSRNMNTGDFSLELGDMNLVNPLNMFVHLNWTNSNPSLTASFITKIIDNSKKYVDIKTTLFATGDNKDHSVFSSNKIRSTLVVISSNRRELSVTGSVDRDVNANKAQIAVAIDGNSLSRPVNLLAAVMSGGGGDWNVSVSNVKLPVGCVYGVCVMGNYLGGSMSISLPHSYSNGHVNMAVYDMDLISRWNLHLGSSWEFRDEKLMTALFVNGVKDSKAFVKFHSCMGSQLMGMYRNIAGQILISQDKTLPVDYNNALSTTSVSLCAVPSIASPFPFNTISDSIALNFNTSVNFDHNFPHWEILLNHIDGKVLDSHFSTKNAEIWTAHSQGDVITVNSNIESQWRRCKSPVTSCGWHNGSVDASFDWMNKDNSPLAWSLQSTRFDIVIDPKYPSPIILSPRLNISIDLSQGVHGHTLIDVRELNFLRSHFLMDNTWDFRADGNSNSHLQLVIREVQVFNIELDLDLQNSHVDPAGTSTSTLTRFHIKHFVFDMNMNKSLLLGGLEAGAPWPTARHSSLRSGSSPFIGHLSRSSLPRWKFITTNGNILTQPIIDRIGNIYIITSDGCLSAIHEMNDNIPNLIWSYCAEFTSFSTPNVLKDGTIAVFTLPGRMFILSKTGKLLSSTDVLQTFAPDSSLVDSSSPVIGDEGMVYLSATNALFCAYLIKEQRCKWTKRFFENVKLVTTSRLLLTVVTWSNIVYRFDAMSGHLLNSDMSTTWSTAYSSDIAQTAVLSSSNWFSPSFDEKIVECMYVDGFIKFKYISARLTSDYTSWKKSYDVSSSTTSDETITYNVNYGSNTDPRRLPYSSDSSSRHVISLLPTKLGTGYISSGKSLYLISSNFISNASISMDQMSPVLVDAALSTYYGTDTGTIVAQQMTSALSYGSIGYTYSYGYYSGPLTPCTTPLLSNSFTICPGDSLSLVNPSVSYYSYSPSLIIQLYNGADLVQNIQWNSSYPYSVSAGFNAMSGSSSCQTVTARVSCTPRYPGQNVYGVSAYCSISSGTITVRKSSSQKIQSNPITLCVGDAIVIDPSSIYSYSYYYGGVSVDALFEVRSGQQLLKSFQMDSKVISSKESFIIGVGDVLSSCQTAITVSVSCALPPPSGVTGYRSCQFYGNVGIAVEKTSTHKVSSFPIYEQPSLGADGTVFVTAGDELIAIGGGMMIQDNGKAYNLCPVGQKVDLDGLSSFSSSFDCIQDSEDAKITVTGTTSGYFDFTSTKSWFMSFDTLSVFYYGLKLVGVQGSIQRCENSSIQVNSHFQGINYKGYPLINGSIALKNNNNVFDAKISGEIHTISFFSDIKGELNIGMDYKNKIAHIHLNDSINEQTGIFITSAAHWSSGDIIPGDVDFEANYQNNDLISIELRNSEYEHFVFNNYKSHMTNNVELIPTFMTCSLESSGEGPIEVASATSPTAMPSLKPTGHSIVTSRAPSKSPLRSQPPHHRHRQPSRRPTRNPTVKKHRKPSSPQPSRIPVKAPSALIKTKNPSVAPVTAAVHQAHHHHHHHAHRKPSKKPTRNPVVKKHQTADALMEGWEQDKGQGQGYYQVILAFNMGNRMMRRLNVAIYCEQ
eukprot:gene3433-6813_t